MYRYLLFAWGFHEPGGGMLDCALKTNSIAEINTWVVLNNRGNALRSKLVTYYDVELDHTMILDLDRSQYTYDSIDVVEWRLTDNVSA